MKFSPPILSSVKKIFDDTRSYNDTAYTAHRHSKNAAVLPMFFVLMGLQRLLVMAVFLTRYPVGAYFETDPNSPFTLYSVFYFIFLVLASVFAKKFHKRLEAAPNLTSIIFFMALGFLITDDFFTSLYFHGLFNPVSFIAGAVILGVPHFTKRAAMTVLACYYVMTLLYMHVLLPALMSYIIAAAYTSLLAVIAAIIIASIKTNQYHLFLKDAENKEKTQNLTEMAVTDALTKISNRRAFDEYIGRAWEINQAKKTPITVMMMDVDNFKMFNDHFGHIEGDKCLITVAEAISAEFKRRGDLFARYGGEEFVAVLVNDQDNDDIAEFAEKIRAKVADMQLPNPLNARRPYITISIGIASRMPTESDSPVTLITLADAALYKAKQAGRNRIAADFSQGRLDQDIETSAQTLARNTKDELSPLSALLQANMLATFSYDAAADTIEIGEDGGKISVDGFIDRAHAKDRAMVASVMRSIGDKTYDQNSYSAFRFDFDGMYIWVSMRIAYCPTTGVVLGALFDYSSTALTKEKMALALSGASKYHFEYDFAADTFKFNSHFAKDFALGDTIMNDGISRLSGHVATKDGRQELLQLFSDIVSGQQYIKHRFNIRNPVTKALQWLLVKAECSRAPDGTPEFLAGSISDITKIVRDEQLNNLIIEGSSDCIFIFDLENDIFEFSTKIFEMVNTRTRKMRGGMAQWLGHIAPKDRHIFTDALAAAAKGDTDGFKAEFRVIGKQNQNSWLAMSGKTMFDEEGKAVIIAGSIMSLANLHQFSAWVDRTRNLDKLTGLNNRAAFYQDLDEIGDAAPGAYVAMVDIDDFANINSLYGVAVGDKLLIKFAGFLSEKIPENARLYHFDANLFVLFCPDTSLQEIGNICENILEGAALGLSVDDVHIKLTASIGISDFSQLQCLSDVIVNAEIALGKAKKGKNKADYFLPDDRVAYNNRVILEAEIRQCVLDNFAGFEIFYQPIISVALSMMVGTEALLRWRSRAGGIVSPAVVIPALLNIGMFEEVETWVFKTAAEQCAKWAEMTGYDDFVMNINMSVKRAGKAGLVEELRQVVEASGVGMHNIFLEITEESFAMQNQSNVIALENLNDQGFLLAIDDFGTGYSSLGYIRNLPVSSLKIDRAFLLDIETNETSRRFVGNIIQLGHIMNYYVCVEGVETQAQARILTELNADTLQGYHYSPPLQKDLLEQKFLAEMTSRARFDEIFADLRGRASQLRITNDEL